MAIKKRKQAIASETSLRKKEIEFINRVDSTQPMELCEPWNGLDPDEKFCPGDGKAINVKLNRYEYAMLKHLSQRENRSLHRQIKHILVTTLRASLKEKVVSE